MKQIWKGKGIFQHLSPALLSTLVLAGLLLCSPAQKLQAQTQTAASDSIVQITADTQGLPLVSPDQLPRYGTFWLVMPGGPNACSWVPMPTPPFDAVPVYQVADGQFIVDGTIGQASPTEQLLNAQSNAIVSLIYQIQGAQTQPMTMTSMDSPSAPFSGSAGGSDYASNTTTYSFDTNQLWLEITNVYGGLTYENLHNATNQVYAIWATTNLLIPFSAWQVATEVWPTDTNCMPFTVPTLNQSTLFLRAEDWTGVESNGLPCWWTWLYFGNLSENATNLDSQGLYTLGDDYLLSLDPNVISFTLSYTNQYANVVGAPIQLDVTAGGPSYFAVLVDDTNYADANWTAYSSSNIIVNLGSTEGWHRVYVGLRGLPATAYQTWRTATLKLNLSPPLLVITNPSSGTVTQPVIQLQGYSPEALASISYDLTNAAGSITNQQTLVLGEYYDTNTLEWTTNYFQCFDVPLTNGLNMVTIHATDLAGNVSTTNLSFTLDYSSATNPPIVQLDWPQAGAKISGNSFTARGRVSDPTSQISVQIVDTNSVTNSIFGRVGRDGDFYVDNVPLSGGINNMSVIATDAAGNTTVTTIPVAQSSLILTITAAGLGQAVTGTISDTNYTIWVNGVMATNNMDGTWIAQDPHLTLATPTVQVRAIPNSDNGGYGGGQ